MNRLTRDPYRLVLETAIAILGIIALLVVATGHSRTRLPPERKPPKTIYTHVPTIAGGEKLFGLQAIRGPVHSQYLYEASLLGTYPVDDIDFLTPYGSNELVTLPGYRTDRYLYRYTSYIPGSGTISCWTIAANGGRFCFLHLALSNIGTPRLPALPLFPRAPLWTRKRELSGDELTALAVLAQRPIDAPTVTAAQFTGGFAVGRTGWPTDPVYGNGLAGPANSQLCLLLDQAAANWFESILDGSHKPPKPKPFPLKAWYGWFFAHPKAQHVSPYDHHYHLYRAARAWRSHARTFRGVVSKRYFPKSRTNRYAYTSWRFRCADMFIWSTGRVKVQNMRCLK